MRAEPRVPWSFSDLAALPDGEEPQVHQFDVLALTREGSPHQDFTLTTDASVHPDWSAFFPFCAWM
jgi:hypothetical protein